MKHLLLLRHGHSGEKLSGHTDKQRTLSIIGVQQASAAGIFLHDRNITVNTIVTSSADRALSTANLVAERIRFSSEAIVVDEDLYNGSVGTYINVIGNCDNHQHLLLVGHNPTISYLVEFLTKSASGDMAPGDLLVLSLDIQRWKELGPGKASIAMRFSPTRTD